MKAGRRAWRASGLCGRRGGQGRPPGWAHRAQLEADRVRACEYTHRDSDLQAMLSISLGDFNLRLIYLLDLQLIEESSTSVTFIFK